MHRNMTVRRAASEEDRAGLHRLRREVFVEEQGVPEPDEFDAADATALHAAAVQGGEVVGTGRLVPLGDGQAQIGRMAVRADLRRTGVGTEVLRFLEGEARGLGVRQIILHAQTYVAAFYRGAGYREEGEVFLEEGIEHVLMWKQL